MIDLNTKEQIKGELNKRVMHIGSAKKAEVELGISNATISNMLNDKASLISDNMWRKMASALGLKLDEKWQHADTIPFTKFSNYFNDARLHANVFGIVTNPGGGKTYTLDYNREMHKNVFYVKCFRSTTERDFLADILRSMRKIPQSYRISELLKEVVKEVSKAESPVIIIDEFEKVKTEVFLLSIDLYNALEDKCGLVFIGTQNLKARIETGVQRGTLGFNEFLSRIGGKVIEIPAPTHTDAALVISRNGVSDMKAIDLIISKSDNDNHEVDLRRVKRLIHAHKQIAA